MRRVFVDANVLIAGAHSRSGASWAVLMLAEVGLIKLVVSRQILDEVERNIRAKLPGAMKVLVEILALLELEIVNDPAREEWEPFLEIIEENDAPILAAAASAKVDSFITSQAGGFSNRVEHFEISIREPTRLLGDLRKWISRTT